MSCLLQVCLFLCFNNIIIIPQQFFEQSLLNQTSLVAVPLLDSPVALPSLLTVLSASQQADTSS